MNSNPIPPDLAAYCTKATVAIALAAPDGDHELLLVNEPFHKLTGYDAQEILGRNCRLLQRDADNEEARGRIHSFLRDDKVENVRTTLVNFRRDGSPFVNLLYMSKLRDLSGRLCFMFASQFDVSRSQPDRLAAYDEALGQTLDRLTPLAAESGLIVEGSLLTIANTAATIARARMTLGELNASHGS